MSEMDQNGKISVGKNAFPFPMPVTLLGATVDGKPNFMALGWVSRVNANPPMIGCGVGRHHHTPAGIKQNKTFSVNVPSRSMMAVADYCGIVSGDTTDKAGLFSVFYGELKTAPMIRECPVCIECRLLQSVNYPTNEFFIGEIVASYTEERYLTGGKPDMKKIDPLLLSMPDNRYWTLGEHAGDAWSIGKSLRK
ncbi:MAG TPA: flavin reductase family protein [Methanoregulaceae archaeon]|nr:flavin reductase family protein [Methanoregulaceae archaeon]